MGHGTRCEITFLWPSDRELRGLAFGKYTIVSSVIIIILHIYVIYLFILIFNFFFNIFSSLQFTGFILVLKIAVFPCVLENFELKTIQTFNVQHDQGVVI